jgi:hypothetical protein
MKNVECRNSLDYIFCAYPESPGYHKKTPVGAASSREIKWSRLEAAPTTNKTCSFQITGLIIFISTADDSMENSQFFKNRQHSLIRHSSIDIRHSSGSSFDIRHSFLFWS